MSEDGIFYYLLLLSPFVAFYELFKRHWTDKWLIGAFWLSVPLGFLSAIVVKVIYIVLDLLLGFELQNFISLSEKPWLTLLINVCVVGFVEEFAKASGGLVSGLFNKEGTGSSAVFLNFIGCALGFSFFENLQFFYRFGGEIVSSRILAGTVAHVFFASVCAYIVITARAKSIFLFMNKPVDPKATQKDLALIGERRGKLVSLFISIGMVLGVFVASICHGLFNFCIFHFNLTPFGGVLLSVFSIMVLLTCRFWILSMRLDIPNTMFISSCPRCGKISFLPFHFCSLCGSRVRILRHYALVMDENDDNDKEEKSKSDAKFEEDEAIEPLKPMEENDEKSEDKKIKEAKGDSSETPANGNNHQGN